MFKFAFISRNFARDSSSGRLFASSELSASLASEISPFFPLPFFLPFFFNFFSFVPWSACLSFFSFFFVGSLLFFVLMTGSFGASSLCDGFFFRKLIRFTLPFFFSPFSFCFLVFLLVDCSGIVAAVWSAFGSFAEAASSPDAFALCCSLAASRSAFSFASAFSRCVGKR